MALGTMAALAASLSWAQPAMSAESGNVDATVTVAEGGGGGGCILVGTTKVDFGEQDFQVPEVPENSEAGEYSITNCGQTPASFFGRSTNATGQGVTWALRDELGHVCEVGANVYRNGLRNPDSAFIVPFSSVDKGISRIFDGPTAAGESIRVVNYLRMPCEGSDGAGQTMSFSFTYTAVAEG